MLKIKDDVDLKELEKFGFTENSKNYSIPAYNYHYYSCLDFEVLEDDYTPISEFDKMFNFARRLRIKRHNASSYDLLYDLITVGLVEKVKEKSKRIKKVKEKKGFKNEISKIRRNMWTSNSK